jgi:hypothetical protein
MEKLSWKLRGGNEVENPVSRCKFEPRTSRIRVNSVTTPLTRLFITVMIINSHNNNKSHSIVKRNTGKLCSPRAQFSMTRDSDVPPPPPPTAGVPTKSIEGRSSRKDAAIRQETLQGCLFYWYGWLEITFTVGHCRWDFLLKNMERSFLNSLTIQSQFSTKAANIKGRPCTKSLASSIHFAPSHLTFLKISFNIILHSLKRSYEWLLSMRLP